MFIKQSFYVTVDWFQFHKTFLFEDFLNSKPDQSNHFQYLGKTLYDILIANPIPNNSDQSIAQLISCLITLFFLVVNLAKTMKHGRYLATISDYTVLISNINTSVTSDLFPFSCIIFE